MENVLSIPAYPASRYQSFDQFSRSIVLRPLCLCLFAKLSQRQVQRIFLYQPGPHPVSHDNDQPQSIVLCNKRSSHDIRKSTRCKWPTRSTGYGHFRGKLLRPDVGDLYPIFSVTQRLRVYNMNTDNTCARMTKLAGSNFRFRTTIREMNCSDNFDRAYRCTEK